MCVGWGGGGASQQKQYRNDLFQAISGLHSVVYYFFLEFVPSPTVIFIRLSVFVYSGEFSCLVRVRSAHRTSPVSDRESAEHMGLWRFIYVQTRGLQRNFHRLWKRKNEDGTTQFWKTALVIIYENSSLREFVFPTYSLTNFFQRLSTLFAPP